MNFVQMSRSLSCFLFIPRELCLYLRQYPQSIRQRHVQLCQDVGHSTAPLCEISRKRDACRIRDPQSGRASADEDDFVEERLQQPNGGLVHLELPRRFCRTVEQLRPTECAIPLCLLI